MLAFLALTAHASDWISLEQTRVEGGVQVTAPQPGTLDISFLTRGVDCSGCTCFAEVFFSADERMITWSFTPPATEPIAGEPAEEVDVAGLLLRPPAERITDPCRRMSTVVASGHLVVEAGTWTLPAESRLSVRFHPDMLHPDHRVGPGGLLRQ